MATPEQERLVADNHSDTIAMRSQTIGSIFAGRYEIVRLLGKGGMSSVYEIRHLHLSKKRCALKLLHPHLISDQGMLLRFKQEAVAISSLQHENIVCVQDFGVSDSGQPYLVMDLVEGISLAELLRREGTLPPERAAAIFAQACAGVAHAHSRGIVHRDLKPANIMLTKADDESESVKIVDFGIAKLLLPQEGEDLQQLTQTGEVFGSPLYMSPEQSAGLKLDERADIYSMGCMLYEALSGKPPHRGNTVFETISKHATELPTPLTTLQPPIANAARWDAVILKSMAADREQRYKSIEEMSGEISDIANAQGRGFLQTLVHHWHVSRIKGSTLRRRLPIPLLAALTISTALLVACATWFIYLSNGTPSLKPLHDWGSFSSPVVHHGDEDAIRSTELKILLLLRNLDTANREGAAIPLEEEFKKRSRAANWFYTHGRFALASDQYDRIIQHCGAHLHTLALPDRGDLYQRAADSHYAQGNIDQARHYFEQATNAWGVAAQDRAEAGQWSTSGAKLGDLYLKLGRLRDAEKMFDKAMVVDLHERHILPQIAGRQDKFLLQVKLADVSRLLKNYHKAAILYESLISGDGRTVVSGYPPDVSAFLQYYLATCYEALDQPEKAGDLYSRSAQLFRHVHMDREYAAALHGLARSQMSSRQWIQSWLSEIQSRMVWNASGSGD